MYVIIVDGIFQKHFIEVRTSYEHVHVRLIHGIYSFTQVQHFNRYFQSKMET